MKEFLIFIGVGIFCIAAWYYYWVVPHDEALYQIMDCMEDRGDRTERGYKHCFEDLKAAREK